MRRTDIDDGDAPAAREEGARRELVVLTWNVRGQDRPDGRALAEVIDAASPDVVVVQEIRRHQARELAGRLDLGHRWDLKHFPLTPLLPWLGEGLAMLSPHRMLAPGRAVISTATSAWTYRRRIAQWATVVVADESIWVCNVHLTPGDDGAAQRHEEARRIDRLAAEHAGGLPVVIAGDLNDGEDPTVMALLPAVEHVRPAPTNPAAAPHQVLDHVLLPPDAEGVGTTVPDGGPTWAALSDHLPVTCRFLLP